MHAFRCYIFAARIACDSGPTCIVCYQPVVADLFISINSGASLRTCIRRCNQTFNTGLPITEALLYYTTLKKLTTGNKLLFQRSSFFTINFIKFHATYLVWSSLSHGKRHWYFLSINVTSDDGVCRQHCSCRQYHNSYNKWLWWWIFLYMLQMIKLDLSFLYNILCVSEKVNPFYLCYYSVKCLISIIFGSTAAEFICNQRTYSFLVISSCVWKL